MRACDGIFPMWPISASNCFFFSNQDFRSFVSSKCGSSIRRRVLSADRDFRVNETTSDFSWQTAPKGWAGFPPSQAELFFFIETKYLWRIDIALLSYFPFLYKVASVWRQWGEGSERNFVKELNVRRGNEKVLTTVQLYELLAAALYLSPGA